MKKILIFTFVSILQVWVIQAQDRPNILWLVCEDMSPYLSSYGNKQVKTPNLDSLAANGIRYSKAHSNAAQCSPSRSTLISGKYAVSLGTDVHRQKRPVPDEFYFPKYLRDAGYFTSNNAKQDYNNMKTPANVWDISNAKATYLNRPDKSKPFFSVFNTGITHMVRVATRTLENRSPRSVPISDIQVPSYIPDLPAVRDDIAWNMDAVMLMDEWIGEKLAELRASGEAENTIVFFYSDHGGTVPRGKAYIYESGTLVPMIAYFPEKWKHLANVPLPSVSDRLIPFVDLPATVFNLTGVKTPSFMISKPFLGPGQEKPENTRKYIFTFRSNQSLSYAPSRAITDGRYKLIWNFQSAYPNGTRQDYQWQMPAQQAWEQSHQNGKLNDLHQKFWLPVEPLELYDLKNDSLETINKINDPALKDKFLELKQALQQEMLLQKDLGFMPIEYRHELQKHGALYDVVRSQNIDIAKQIEAAATASYRKVENQKLLEGYLKHKDPVVQYWGASGLCGLAKLLKINKLPTVALDYYQSSEALPEAKCLLAEAKVYLKQNAEESLSYLATQMENGFGPSLMVLQNLGSLASPINNRLKTALAKPETTNKFYIRSILINTGVLPYSELYNKAEKVGD
ncbi:sulfatase [Sphingobacterium sp. HJSM2_6]|uniref:sulfatase family protein n=1 Tax=Sphingobacterium sp. HJSM2_6 TaxID=3366264 RepID=UPI003BC9EA25